MFAPRSLFVLALGVAFVGAPTVRAQEQKPVKPQPGAESGKTIVIQIDASKLSPDLLKQLIQLSEKPGDKPKPGAEPVKPGIKPGAEPVKPGDKPKPGAEPVKPVVKPGAEPVKPGAKPGKAISLSDAIAIAEKNTQGTVVKAEREDEDGKVSFELEVIDGKGGKSKLIIDANGNVTKKGEKPNK